MKALTLGTFLRWQRSLISPAQSTPVTVVYVVLLSLDRDSCQFLFYNVQNITELFIGCEHPKDIEKNFIHH